MLTRYRRDVKVVVDQRAIIGMCGRVCRTSAVPIAERLPEHSGSTRSVDEPALIIGPADSRKTRPL